MIKSKGVTVRNLIFPIWMLLLFPLTWVIILPLNYIIDSLVVLITLKLCKDTSIKQHWKEVIDKVWIYGFAADLIGVVPIMLLNKIPSNSEFFSGKISSFQNAISYDPFQSIWSLMAILFSIGLAAICIYLFNRKICLKHLDIDEQIKKKMALNLAILTAPYVLLVPATWLYGSM